jgi:hypothetical protein
VEAGDLAWCLDDLALGRLPLPALNIGEDVL